MSGIQLSRWMIFLATLVVGAVPAAEPAHPWPIKKFKIFVGKPRTTLQVGANPITGEPIVWEQILYDDPEGTVLGDEELTPSIPVAPAKADIEKFLSESADTLEAWGFKPPVIHPKLRNDNGDEYFRIYYHDFGEHENGSPDNTPAVWRSDQCGRFKATISLNAQAFLDGSSNVKPRSYQNLAHELFHGVQARYPIFQEHCRGKPGDWLYEGSAQALGADVAAWGPRQLNNPHSRENKWVIFRWGIRPYDRTLFVKDQRAGGWSQDIAYGTSSFWRFLGEYSARSGSPDLRMVKPDYHYLIDFMNSSLGTGDPDLESSMAWIDQQLTAHPNFKLGLERIYTHFISTFANYGGTRIRPPEFGAGYREKWLKGLFSDGECPVVELSTANSAITLPLHINPYASRCFRVKANFAFDTDVHVSIFGDTEASINQVSFGTKGGEIYVRPILHSYESKWKGNSIFSVPAGYTRIVAFTNVPLESGNTKKLRNKVEFSATRSKNNMAVYGPAPPAYGPQPPTGDSASDPASGDAATSTQSLQAQIAANLEAGMEILNPNTAHGNTMTRNANARPCSNPFVSQACGPQTTVRLEMMPGSFGSLRTSTGRGGIFGQVTSMMSGLAASEMMFSSDKTQAALEKSESMDASLVLLRFPLIDYGFSGTFENALIVANRKGGGRWESVEPGGGDAATGQGPKLTGRVTIEEYSPSILRGSYSGTLVESYESGEESGNEVPATRHINGTFQVVATWSGDDRIKVVVDSPEQIMEDFTDQLGVDTSGYEIIQVGDKQQVVPKQQGSATSSSGGVASGECSCECEMREFADDLCELFCEEEFAACDRP